MSDHDKKLFLLDAFALIYRAHFAFSKNPRITSKGMSTGAVFGFTNTLLEVLNKEKPTHIGIAFDTAAPTFRHEQFEAYKAQRQEQPEDITIAIPYVKKLAEGFGIPILELDGYEADDVIGTLAKQAAGAGFRVYMMTPDKDYSQLVSDQVFLYKPAFMGKGVDILGEKEVLEKWEIKNVDQVRDILGLQGDAVDNIPGIPGIGEKTAKKLIQEYGTVENLVAKANEIKGKMGENIRNFGAQGILSKELATINTQVPLEFDADAMAYSGPQEDILKPLFEELEFRTVAARVLGVKTPIESGQSVEAATGQMSLFGGSAPTDSMAVDTSSEEDGSKPYVPKRNILDTDHKYHIVERPEILESLVNYLLAQKEICFDTETTSLEPLEAELVGFSFAYMKGEAYYVPVPEEKDKAQQLVDLFRPVLENKEILKIGQNIKYDYQVLKNYGVTVQGPMFDTMLAHYLIEPEMRHNMDVLSEVYLNYSPVSITELIGKKGTKQGNMRDANLAEIAEYAGEDADITLQLKEVFHPVIKERGLDKLLNEVEMPLMEVLADMELEGIRIDVPALKEFSKELETDIGIAERRVFDIAGIKFNLSSPKQLGEVLFEKMQLDPKAKKTKTGQYATGEDVLVKLASEHEIAKRIMEYRELQKLKSTYVDALPEMISPVDGRVHTSYNQAVAATGRLSSTNPNLQNIPIRTEKGREIRKAFIPRDDGFTLMSADYSQIELRLMAEFSKDDSMLEAFRQGRDIHATTASKVYKVGLDEVTSEMRRNAKMVNFGIIYGISAFGLAQRLDIPRREAVDIIDAYFREFPGVKRYMDESVNKARELEYVETILGRRRYLRDINSRNITMRGFAERNAINAPIQGSAADMIKVAMIRIHDWMQKEKLKSRMLLQVHDELVFDVHRDETAALKKHVEILMREALPLSVPIEVGIGFGENWLEAH